MAMNDSLVASFLNKYHYNFWRPETAIHAGDTDGNPKTDGDPNWAPFIVTPCFPSYPSNHGSAGNGGGRSAETSLRRSWTFDHVDESCGAQHRLAIHARLNRLPTTSPTRAFMAGYIFELTKKQGRTWAGLSAPQCTRTTCVRCTMLSN